MKIYPYCTISGYPSWSSAYGTCDGLFRGYTHIQPRVCRARRVCTCDRSLWFVHQCCDRASLARNCDGSSTMMTAYSKRCDKYARPEGGAAQRGGIEKPSRNLHPAQYALEHEYCSRHCCVLGNRGHHTLELHVLPQPCYRQNLGHRVPRASSPGDTPCPQSSPIVEE